MHIHEDDPREDQVARLLEEHLSEMHVHCPPDSIHALDIDGLCAPKVTFWTVREEDALLGCGALLELDTRLGEIKSMRTASDHLRKGVASRLLQHMIAEAQRRAYTRLSLETGSQTIFGPARALYSRFGFEVCAPFANYILDPNSIFMTKNL